MERNRAAIFAYRLTAIAGLLLMALPGPVGALYPPDGTKPDGAGGYMIPADGMCVIGIKLDGTMLVDWSITNYRDCVAWTKSADGSVDLVAMNTQATCLNATNPPVAPNDGYRHAWSTSLCYDTVNNKGISRVDLDNTDAMCFSKGGTVVTTGKCVAYGWVYRNRKADNTLPVTGTGLSTTDGVQSTAGLGFCATAMRMTGGTFNSATTCPSTHNSAKLCVGGTAAGAACTTSATCTGSGSCNPNPEWPSCASSTSGCQTQTSYNDGLGWSFSGGNCVYTYGVKGVINAAATKADGTTYAAASTQDLTLYTNQGDCLANGFSWDNWLPVTPTTTASNGTPPADVVMAGLPAGTVIRRLNALSPVEDGGGEFYSGTGAVCEKCHSDQSRAYMERFKPGFPKTRHKLAGDATGKPFQPFFTAANSAWGLQGVQCAMCHSTAKPAQDDLIQVVPAGVVGPPAAGAPKSAAGHNNTEYGTHLLDVCYTCHGTAATPSSTNPASVIPVSAGDFALTGKCVSGSNAGAACTLPLECPGGGCAGGLAPIANQFLNSPHAQYQGSSAKIDIGNKTFYNSTFEGYVCRTAATQFRSTAPPGDSQANCVAAGLTWYTTTGFGNFCYYNASSCTSLNATGQWLSSFDNVAYAWAAASGGPGGLCVGIGIGSIITTVYRDGVAEKIPNLDSTTNPACTNAGDGSATSGASGFWVKDGETSNGTPTDTAQGNCMTCHDVHWAMADTDPEAEAFRRECTTCHANPGASASGAPQINVATINHLKGAGTPLENVTTSPDEACEICHMPPSSSGGSRMHLWRINTNPSYTTMGTSQANTTTDGSAWVDLDHACGQCHGGSGPAQPGVPYFTTAQLSLVAKGMHDSAGVTYPITFSYTVSNPNTLNVTVSPTVDCGAVACPGFTYDWDWGDTTAHGTTNPASHTYAAEGPKSVTLTVKLASSGGTVGTVTRTFTVFNPDMPPTLVGTCTFDPDKWIETVVDSSTDDGGDPDMLINDGAASMRVRVDWGDATSASMRTGNGTLTHTFLRPGTFTPKHTVTDSLSRSAFQNCSPVSPAYFLIEGKVVKSDGTTPIASAVVRVQVGTTVLKYTYSGATGLFSIGALKPGTYTLTTAKPGYTFPASAPITVGPSKLNPPAGTGITITANPPPAPFSVLSQRATSKKHAIRHRSARNGTR